MSKSALASLTAQYTDSENEDDHRDGSTSPEDSQNSQASQVIPAQTPEKLAPTDVKIKKKKRRKSVRRLVSYKDDTIVSDEAEDESDTTEDSETESENDNYKSSANSSGGQRNGATPMDVDDNVQTSPAESKNTSKSEKMSKYAHYNFSLPPEPKGKTSTELVEKIRQLYEKMETNNMDMNRLIQDRKDFRNPSIYEKLIQFCDINEFGTNYPPEMYDPLQWGAESYYEELARVQKNEMLKRQKERKDTDKIEQATALARKVEEEAKKRKSKWDQPAKPVVIPPTLTTTVTGTKGTVISAFGSLANKDNK